MIRRGNSLEQLSHFFWHCGGAYSADLLDRGRVYDICAASGRDVKDSNEKTKGPDVRSGVAPLTDSP